MNVRMANHMVKSSDAELGVVGCCMLIFIKPLSDALHGIVELHLASKQSFV